jgi:MFS family permease
MAREVRSSGGYESVTSTGGSLMGNGRFLKLWVGQGVSFVGDAISTVALVILVIQISGSAAAVGGVLLFRLLPTLASPLVGVLADRLDRRVVLVACDLLRAAIAVGLVFVQNLPALYALAFLMGTATTFFNPTVRAAFPSVVGSGDLTRANALISGTFSVSITVGPALGGLLVAFVGVDAAFAVDAATFLVSAAFLSRIPLPGRPEAAEGASFLAELGEGFRYLAGAPVALGIVTGAFLATVTANATVPAEAFLAREVFGAGNIGYGLLVSVWGGGMVLGSSLMAVLGDRAARVGLYLVAVFVTALALAAAGLSPTFVLALIVLAVAGTANGVDNVVTDTVLQKRVPEALLGRVFATRFLAFSAGEALAYAGGGFLVELLGTRSTYVLAGAATAVAGLLVLLIIVAVPPKSRADEAKPHQP